MREDVIFPLSNAVPLCNHAGLEGGQARKERRGRGGGARNGEVKRRERKGSKRSGKWQRRDMARMREEKEGDLSGLTAGEEWRG